MPLTLIVFAILLPNSSAKPATPYNPKPLMAKLEATKDKPITDMYFLVFGDSKLSPHFNTVLKRADTLAPDFNITTADLVDTGGGTKGITEYEFLEQQGRKKSTLNPLKIKNHFENPPAMSCRDN